MLCKSLIVNESKHQFLSEALPPWLEIDSQPLSLREWLKYELLKESHDHERDLGQKLADSSTIKIGSKLWNVPQQHMHMKRPVQSPLPTLAKIGLMRNNHVGEIWHSFDCIDGYNDNNTDKNKGKVVIIIIIIIII